MTKDTINKVFQKAFHSNIWKIEIDSEQSLIATETRDTDTTNPSFYVFDFLGNDRMSPLETNEKEWTLDSIQNGHIVLKCVGEHTPVQEGVQIIRAEDQHVVYFSHQQVLVDTFKNFIVVRHRNIVSGGLLRIDLSSGKTSPYEKSAAILPHNAVRYPVSYPKTPPFLKEDTITRPLWLAKTNDRFIWCHHHRVANTFNLILTLTDLNHILDQQVILSEMEKMIPQPYFQLGNQIFFMSFNKREIMSFLV